jgi:hypothetical protein
MNAGTLQWIKKFFKDTFLIGLVISLPVYAWVRLIFFEVPFSLSEDTITLFKVLMTGWIIMICLKGAFYTLLVVGQQCKKMKVSVPVFKTKWAFTALAVAVLCSMLYACNGQGAAGISKDFNTGLVATYKTMQPVKVSMVMNDEVLNHTDIPIGESFLLVNEGVTGLTEKDGKVSVGCSLVITDKNGLKLLDEKDLFRGHDIYEPNNARTLRCTVNTGKPMNWEEKYDVVATFWDKYGSGTITNKVTVRMIDIP